MIRKLGLIFIFAYMLLSSAAAYSDQNKKIKGNTVNILIDVSGSMKKNDPENRRISAVKLLINLLPDGTKAGIWLFAENTKLLVKTTGVNSRWKKKALSVVNRIHSRGVYTHIENAIQTTLKDEFTETENKNLILLTDGMVDISRDIMESADSRERIIADLIPLLQQQQVSVNTIALSDNADKELLEKLAFDTNGWAESPQSSEQLQKAFLKMFNKALPQDSVPLNNNIFTIDDSIKEFSVLVFKKPGAPKTQIIGPDKHKFSSKTRAENLSWVQDAHYDLITMQKPVAGDWKIEAEMDLDNQVMVMTDLQLNINDLPGYIAEQEVIDVQVNFSEQGRLITRQDFLEFIDVSLQQTDDLKRKSTWKMQADPNKSGYFRQKIGDTLGKGRHTLKVVADSKTFQREIVRTIEVVESAVKIKKSFDPKSQMITLELLPDEEIIDADMMTARVVARRPSKEDDTFEIKNKDGRMLLSLERPEQGEKVIVNFSIMAKTVRGEPITPDIKPVIINDKFIAQFKKTQEIKPETEAETDSQENELEQKTLVQNKKDTEDVQDDSNYESLTGDVEDTDDTETEESGSWLMVIGAVVVINILLITGGFFSYKYLKKRTAEKQEQLLERLA